MTACRFAASISKISKNVVVEVFSSESGCYIGSTRGNSSTTLTEGSN